MTQGELIRILDEIKKIKIEKDNVIKEENKLYEEFNNFSNSFDKFINFSYAESLFYEAD